MKLDTNNKKDHRNNEIEIQLSQESCLILNEALILLYQVSQEGSCQRGLVRSKWFAVLIDLSFYCPVNCRQQALMLLSDLLPLANLDVSFSKIPFIISIHNFIIHVHKLSFLYNCIFIFLCVNLLICVLSHLIIKIIFIIITIVNTITIFIVSSIILMIITIIVIIIILVIIIIIPIIIIINNKIIVVTVLVIITMFNENL